MYPGALVRFWSTLTNKRIIFLRLDSRDFDCPFIWPFSFKIAFLQLPIHTAKVEILMSINIISNQELRSSSKYVLRSKSNCACEKNTFIFTKPYLLVLSN